MSLANECCSKFKNFANVRYLNNVKKSNKENFKGLIKQLGERIKF